MGPRLVRSGPAVTVAALTDATTRGINSEDVSRQPGWRGSRTLSAAERVNSCGGIRGDGAQEVRQDLLERRLALVEKAQAGDTAPGSDVDWSQSAGWVPPRRGHGLPDAGVVVLEKQVDEEHAFGPAVELVREWQRLRTGGAGTGSRAAAAPRMAG